jgi:hypothetical protein
MAAGHDRMSLKARINDYIPYAQRLPARWDELAGVAQGSCLAIEDVLLMQMLEDLLDVDACTTAGRAGFLLHAEMWFASHTDYAVLISEPADGPPVITVSCIGFLTGVGLNGSGFAMGVQSTSSRDVRVGVPRAMVSRSALCALSAAEAVREATRHHRSGGNGFVIVIPTGVQVVETSAAIDDVTEERPWGAHTNHYISDKFQTVANSAGESVQRPEEAVATLGGVSDRELMERARFLVQSPGFVPPQPRPQCGDGVRHAGRHRGRVGANRARRGRARTVGARDSALDSMAWQACAGRLRTGTSLTPSCHQPTSSRRPSCPSTTGSPDARTYRSGMANRTVCVGHIDQPV